MPIWTLYEIKDLHFARLPPLHSTELTGAIEPQSAIHRGLNHSSRRRGLTAEVMKQPISVPVSQIPLIMHATLWLVWNPKKKNYCGVRGFIPLSPYPFIKKDIFLTYQVNGNSNCQKSSRWPATRNALTIYISAKIVDSNVIFSRPGQSQGLLY